jgi:hypothetical protein
MMDAAGPALAVQDRVAFAATVTEHYRVRVWERFARELRRCVAEGTLLPEHQARADVLLRETVVAKPLRLEDVEAVTALVAQKFLEGNPLTIESGIGLDDLTAILRRRIRARALNKDPLSFTQWVAGKLQGAIVFWDPLEDSSAEDTAHATASPGGRIIYEARQTADRMIANALEESTGSALMGRTIEPYLGASADALHVYLNHPDVPEDVQRTLQLNVSGFSIERVVASGVYCNALLHAHSRSVPREHSSSRPDMSNSNRSVDIAYEIVVYLVIPYAHLGLPGVTGQSMHAGIVKLRDYPTHVWSAPLSVGSSARL